MMDASRVGTLLLSIDLEPNRQQGDDEPERLDYIRRRLIDLLCSHAIAATWAVADPVHSVATDSILSASSSHEIAVLGDQAWLGPGCGRLRLDRELARRFDGARKAGIPVTTLALRNLDQVRDLDLLLDRRITALRGAAAAPSAESRHLAAAPIRYGIWQAPAGRAIPTHSAWWLPASWSIRREIKRAIARSAIVHLQIDAAELVAAGDPGLRTIGRLFRYAAAKRDAGQLTIETIRQVAARVLAERSTAPSRSILRPAA